MPKTSEFLIIDCQVMQTNAWDRGMGKYSLSLIAGLNKLGMLHGKTKLLLNENLPADEQMMQALQAACPKGEVVYLDLAVPSGRRSNSDLETSNQKAIDEYISKVDYDGTIDFLILSLFLDQAFIVFPTLARKLLLFYDLIPFIFEERYAARINYDDYLTRFRVIFDADLIYTISQTVADDLAIYLGIPKQRLYNINGASIDRSHLKSQKPDFGIPNKFILMNSGDELRKNNVNAVKGFAEFGRQQGDNYTLVITSTFSDTTKQELSIYSDQLVFTGNIPEAQLQWLYENAEFILCPSEYEGLGLPVLEAMTADKRIACSNIPVFREISGEAFYFFEPDDPDSIASSLNQALKGHDWDERRKHYKNIMKRYTWDETAKAFATGYDSAFSGPSKLIDAKPKIAVFTPPASGYSGIGKMTAELHASLSEHYDIDYYYDYQKATDKHVRPDFIKHLANCYEASEFSVNRYKKYKFVIYHLGNSDYHLNIIKNALYLPGFAILHDTHLKGAFGELLRLNMISPERMELEEQLNSKSGTKLGSFLTSVLSNQLGIIVHSKYARDVVQKTTIDEVPMDAINLPVETPKIILQRDSSEGMQIGLGGILADMKGLPLIESLANDPEFQDCHFTVFGFSYIKPETIERLQSMANVSVYLDPTDFEFQMHLSKLDTLINYRFEYRGETSLTTLEAMRYGVVPFIRQDGWYGEMPDDAVIHVSDEYDLKTKLLLFKKKRGQKQDMNLKAWQYIDKNYSHDNYANKLQEFVASVLEQEDNPNLGKAKLLAVSKSLQQVKSALGLGDTKD